MLDGEGGPRSRSILSETVLRTPLRDAQCWREQLEHLAAMIERPNFTLHVLPTASGLHGLVSTDVMFLRMLEGRTVAYTENAHQGQLIEEAAPVEGLQLAYDCVRDLAMTPVESRKSVMRMLEGGAFDVS